MLDEFECPVCMNYMQPPIRMCVAGHSFCEACFEKISTCPVCKKAKSDTRNFALEKMFEKFQFPCKYRSHGCKDETKGPLLNQHLENCDYREISCPVLASCKWIGCIHCQTDHSNILNDDCSNIPVMYNVDLKLSNWKLIFKRHGSIFLMQQCIKDSIMCWCVYYFGKTEATNKFSFEVRIAKGILMIGPCQSSQVHKHEISQLGLMIHLDMIKDAIVDDKMDCSIEILKINE